MSAGRRAVPGRDASVSIAASVKLTGARRTVDLSPGSRLGSQTRLRHLVCEPSASIGEPPPINAVGRRRGTASGYKAGAAPAALGILPAGGPEAGQ